MAHVKQMEQRFSTIVNIVNSKCAMACVPASKQMVKKNNNQSERRKKRYIDLIIIIFLLDVSLHFRFVCKG